MSFLFLILKIIVPEGSVLHPLLFIINISDFVNSSYLAYLIIFEVDKHLFLSCHILDDIIENANNIRTVVGRRAMKLARFCDRDDNEYGRWYLIGSISLFTNIG